MQTISFPKLKIIAYPAIAKPNKLENIVTKILLMSNPQVFKGRRCLIRKKTRDTTNDRRNFDN